MNHRRLTTLPKVTQLVRGSAKTQTQVCLISGHESLSFHSRYLPILVCGEKTEEGGWLVKHWGWV
jgi:hypothetical protein